MSFTNTMDKRKIIHYISTILILFIIVWATITVYVEKTGPEKQWTLEGSDTRTALIVYDPDPFYNLDEQVCLAFGKSLADNGITVTIATVAAAQSLKKRAYHVVVYCANTYNWRPDWAITNYVEAYPPTKNNTPVVAITLGAGSTQSSKQRFERTIKKSGGVLIASYTLWLWRPNDETKNQPSNVDVAVAMAHKWGTEVAKRVQN